MAYKDSRRF